MGGGASALCSFLFGGAFSAESDRLTDAGESTSPAHRRRTPRCWYSARREFAVTVHGVNRENRSIR
jgi:hypothetical protein